MPVHLESQFKLAVKASLGEDAIQEGVKKALIKLIVNAATINRLSHQCFQSSPGDLVRSNILATLCVDMVNVTSFCSRKLILIWSAKYRQFKVVLFNNKALTLAVSSSHVSTVSQAERRSDSPNSYFLDQPSGA